ncbi:hypothetical protein M0811_07930 [Anaeramoeba ignava]|uniref:Uncharacterized protein n=1 Tax=Anaeramoeba ignava TaxID=1746090 RepID=A0A9Q0LL82_ANAIG|nr:hypothetical protein M0811_07930 [Anaeramoeba ignava]
MATYSPIFASQYSIFNIQPFIQKHKFASAFDFRSSNSESLIFMHLSGNWLIIDSLYKNKKSVGHIFFHFFLFNCLHWNFEILSSLFQNEENFQGIIEKPITRNQKEKLGNQNRKETQKITSINKRENYNRNSPTQRIKL